jgi:hypothetical protein
MFLKDPEAVVDYQVDWSAALAGALTIASSSWTVTPTEAGGVVVAGAGVDGRAATARLGGGIAGHVYRVGNRVTLSDGSIDERSLVIRVEDR